MPASSFLSSFQPRQDYAAFYAAHDGAYADSVRPADFPETKPRFWNDRWALRIGLGELSAAERVVAFARFTVPAPMAGLQREPLAMRYHGHQFRHYNPQIGDGRGFLFGQCADPVDGRLLDFGTKGSGQTPYSRSGDGRLTLKGAVREALATEMLEALGVNTSKTFSFFETGEQLVRGDEPSPTRSAVLTRLSHGHIRYGTFQRLAVMNEPKLIRELVKYCIDTYFPDLKSTEESERPFVMLERIVTNAADLAASWMIAGFVHGVLNTDNMNITGESFDYGPWRFLPTYDPAFTAAYFDHDGLYAYGRQPESVYWNLDQLARALFVMVPEGSESDWHHRFHQILSKFPHAFQTALLARFFKRLGLTTPPDEAVGEEIFTSVFGFLLESKMGFEEFFYHGYAGRSVAGFDGLSQAVQAGRVWVDFEAAKILESEYYRRGYPETMLIDEVEKIWSAIDKDDDWSLFHAKIEAIRARGRVHGYDV